MCTNRSLSSRNRNVRDKVDSKRAEMTKVVDFEENNRSSDKSSSSSLSWGEDCEQEATQRVKCEYERMQRVLKGLEPIPPNYDRDEYQLWIQTFPSLRSSVQANINTRKRSYPTTPMSSSRISYNKPVQPVIEDFITKLCNKLSNPRPRRQPERRERRRTVDNNAAEVLEKDFKSLLRISPAPTFPKSVSVGARNSLNPTRTQEEAYASLPYLTTPKNNNVKDANLKRTRRKSKNLVLPPIAAPLNQFRSVSAVQHSNNKCCSSVVATKFEMADKDERNLLSCGRGLKRVAFK